jgi:hypothetical protein
MVRRGMVLPAALALLFQIGVAQATSEYDGEWVGEVDLESGIDRCVKHINMSGTIADGKIDIRGTWSGSPVFFRGTVNDDGRIEKGKVRLRGPVTKAVAEGGFADGTISGTWVAEEKCNWTFSFSRAE